MTVVVYHMVRERAPEAFRDLMFADFGMEEQEHADRCAGVLLAGGYEVVAVVHSSSDLDYAYRHTNSVERGWAEPEATREAGVSLAGPPTTRYRSTSVGDVLAVHGRTYVVSGFGFTEVTTTLARLAAYLPEAPEGPGEVAGVREQQPT